MPSSKQLVAITPRVRRGLVAAFFLAMLVGVLLPWWHNHDRVNDFYDYGVTIAAVGRMAHGERPYVDFISPIQTLGFLTSALAEKCFGARYLSLTYMNGVFIVAAMGAFTWLLRRALGWVVATLVAAAVVAATAMQHTIVWYNALGVTWVALTVWLVAAPESSAPRRLWRWLAVFTVLWLSGMTKVTYHVAALAFALLFAGRNALRLAVPRKETVLVVAGVGLFGGVLPVVTEMIYTGATFEVWAHNVFGLAGGRLGLLKTIATPDFYFKPVHNYYSPMYLPAVGLGGVVLLALVMAASGWRIVRSKEGRAKTAVFWLATVVGVFGCSAAFQATNFEIVYTAGAAWLALTVGVVLAFGGDDPKASSMRFMRGILLLAAVGLLVPSWRSAWDGARALFRGMGAATEKTVYISGDDLDDRFSYVRGVLMRQEWHEALKGFGTMLDADRQAGVDARGYLLINGAEWLVRVRPEAVHRGVPLWFQEGTTFSAQDAAMISDRLERGAEIHTVVAIENWDFWGAELGHLLRERYHTEPAPGLLHVYRLNQHFVHPLAEPLAFRWNLETNLPASRFRILAGPVEIQYADKADFIGGWASNGIGVDAGLPNLEGEAVVRLSRWEAPAAAKVTFRIVEETAGGETLVRWEKSLEPTTANPIVVAPFAVELARGPVELQISIPAGVRVDAGWRRFRSREGEVSPPKPPGPIQAKTQPMKVDGLWRSALFGGVMPRIRDIAACGLQITPELFVERWELFAHVGGEIWMELDGRASQVRGEYGLRPGTWEQGASLPGVIVRVVLVHGDRQQELLRKVLTPKTVMADREPQSFDLTLPEHEGWLGLVIEPLQPDQYGWGHTWWRNVRVE